VDPDFQAVAWDGASLVEALRASDAVINLAGASLAGSNPLQMRWTAQRKQAIISSREDAGKKLVDAISKLDRKPEVLLQASAIGYYGNLGLDPADENSGPGNDFLTEVCLDWEAATAVVEEMGVRRVVLRIGLVLSPRGGLLPWLSLPFRLLVGGKIGSGKQYLSWIHMDDIVKSIQYLMIDPKHQGVYNLTSPTPATNLDFSHLLGKTLQRPVWFPFPALALKLALGEAATLALDGRPVYPSRLLQSGYQYIHPDLEQALQDLLKGSSLPN
jgi:uncharacterized protein (TIGR01777 family)